MISAVILVRNSQKTIKKVLESLKEFDEIILYDTGSKDNTIEIAKHFSNVKIFFGLLEGFGPTRNKAASFAKHDWILAIDSDEVVSEELSQEIFSLKLNSNCVYSIPFNNFYKDRCIKWCGWYPESHSRLYNRKKTQFSSALVHESLITNQLEIETLKCPIYHYSYECLADFLFKMQNYSDLFAKQYTGQKKSSPFIAITHSLAAFLKSYFLKKGFLGGYEGFLISVYNAHTAFYKYLKLYESNKLIQKMKK